MVANPRSGDLTGAGLRQYYPRQPTGWWCRSQLARSSP